MHSLPHRNRPATSIANSLHRVLGKQTIRVPTRTTPGKGTDVCVYFSKAPHEIELRTILYPSDQSTEEHLKRNEERGNSFVLVSRISLRGLIWFTNFTHFLRAPNDQRHGRLIDEHADTFVSFFRSSTAAAAKNYFLVFWVRKIINLIFVVAGRREAKLEYSGNSQGVSRLREIVSRLDIRHLDVCFSHPIEPIVRREKTSAASQSLVSFPSLSPPLPSLCSSSLFRCIDSFCTDARSR